MAKCTRSRRTRGDGQQRTEWHYLAAKLPHVTETPISPRDCRGSTATFPLQRILSHYLHAHLSIALVSLSGLFEVTFDGPTQQFPHSPLLRVIGGPARFGRYKN